MEGLGVGSGCCQVPGRGDLPNRFRVGVSVGCGAADGDGVGSPELGGASTGAEASTRAAGLAAGDDDGAGVELSQATSKHATASAIAASIFGGRPSRRVSAWAARDIVHSLV